ncbi:uncharacterized protein C8Q71DRAFT_854498 [Rhodofomes roseus]|uniref:FCP1 homology domain-containing protein n=1 Tax=Rhodofomes roseus TaxID=34475 RepID=A0ABQ8KQ37_9APHY|nr:uncharacterized protein C8Q71DRAFT_854498 [Rhodofomes roseus]KAH9840620.1 hypothetical protein C8Q71DRAFT_854498 [Rhodofomes roseus]
MYGYGSYHSSNHRYAAYNGYNHYPPQAGEWYGDDPGPSSSQPSEFYGYDSYAYDPQYSSQHNYYNGGYHEAGAPSDQGRYPMNSDSYGPYQHTSVRDNRASSRPPRAPKAMRDRGRVQKDEEYSGDREVTPPPIPSPSPEYLALAASAPTPLADTSSSRKLLILDLNGTLVFRSPHASRAKYRPQDRGVPRLRPTYPRPYMRAFCEYLFALETKRWLDVMVWSSAQPHSVNDMVDKCFGPSRRELVAVWARDTLGLSNDHYHRKVQTLKDLSRPWATLPALLTPLPPSPSSSTASLPSSSPPGRPSSPVRSAETTAPHVHSALTTLLLDDSPAKAAMQPYNHFCIPEYAQQQRNKDLENFQKEQQWLLVNERRKMPQGEQAKDAGMARIASLFPPQESGDGDTEPTAKSRKRKRKGKESSQPNPAASPASVASEEDTFSSASSSAASSPAPAPSSPTIPGLPTPAPSSPPEPKKKSRKAKRRKQLEELVLAPEVERPEVSYDETLLAVVGVLDEVRRQANVAAWVREGGLWGPGGVPEHLRRAAEASEEGSGPKVQGEDGEEVEEVADAPQGEKRKRKSRHRTLRKQAEAEATRKAMEGGAAAEAGNDEATRTAAPTDAKGTIDSDVDVLETPASMWFEDPEVLGYWARRGREALHALGISVEHGMEG